MFRWVEVGVVILLYVSYIKGWQILMMMQHK